MKQRVTVAVKRVLYRQQYLEEYKAQIKNNAESFMRSWVYVYEELKKTPTTSTIFYDLNCDILVEFLDVIFCEIQRMFYFCLRSK